MQCIDCLCVTLRVKREGLLFLSSKNSVPTYPRLDVIALYASHPNIIRAKPTMWFGSECEERMDVPLLSGPTWGGITVCVLTEPKVETQRKYSTCRTSINLWDVALTRLKWVFPPTLQHAVI